MRRTLTLLILAIAIAAPAAAKQAAGRVATAAQIAPRAATAPSQVAPRARTTPPPPVMVAEAQTPAPPAPRMPPPVDPRIDTSDVNIGLTINITDKSPSGTQNKVVSLIVANRSSGRVRSSGTTSTPSMGPNASRSSDLNVDALTTLMKSGVISTNLTVSYTPEWTDETTKMTSVTQSVSIFLKDGQPTVIAQAADPTKGSRSVTIEVTAKVIR